MGCHYRSPTSLQLGKGRSGRQGLSCVCDGVNILRKLPIFPVNVKLAQFADCHFEGSEPSRP